MNIHNIVILSLCLGGVSGSLSAAPLQLDAQQGRIEVAVSATVDSFVGHVEKYDAKVECEPQAARPDKAELAFDLAELKTGNKDRDAAMLKWAEYNSKPKVVFHLDSWKQAGTTNIAVGQLTIHGVTQPVESPVIIRQEAGAWDIRGTTEFDYRDFNLPKIRKALVLTVDPHLKVTFHLVGKLTEAK